ncbi:MAG: cob(I)yrinic acid a,c-diamide adenosyltransferase [bacterium]
MIFVLTGKGKGKTTSAIGMGMRAVGAGRKVLMVQFLKVPTSEAKALAKVDNFVLKTFGEKGFPVSEEVLRKVHFSGMREITERDKELAREGFALAKRWVEEGKCDFLILDELTWVLNLSLLDKDEVLAFLKENREKIDIVITGRDCPEEILRLADLITEMKMIRHPYERGIGPRKGIEY